MVQSHPGDQERALRWVGLLGLWLVCFPGRRTAGCCGAYLDEADLLPSADSAKGPPPLPSFCSPIFCGFSQPGGWTGCCSMGFPNHSVCPSGRILCSCSSPTFPLILATSFKYWMLPLSSTGCRPLRGAHLTQHEPACVEGAIQLVPAVPAWDRWYRAKPQWQEAAGRASPPHHGLPVLYLATGPLYPGSLAWQQRLALHRSSVQPQKSFGGGGPTWEGGGALLRPLLDRFLPGCCSDRFPAPG